jgi:hypothetical protein
LNRPYTLAGLAISPDPRLSTYSKPISDVPVLFRKFYEGGMIVYLTPVGGKSLLTSDKFPADSLKAVKNHLLPGVSLRS